MSASSPLAVIDPDTGTLCRVTRKATAWVVTVHPPGGMSSEAETIRLPLEAAGDHIEAAKVARAAVAAAKRGAS